MSRGIRVVDDAGNLGKLCDTVQKTVQIAGQPTVVDITRTVQADPSSDIDQAIMTSAPIGSEGGAVVRPLPWTGSGVSAMQVNPGPSAAPLSSIACKKVGLRSLFKAADCGPIFIAVGGVASVASWPLYNGDVFPFEIPVSNLSQISAICPTNDATLCIIVF
jgi:hypothetical protein